MAKKTKRKVSAVAQGVETAQIREVTAEQTTPERPLTGSTPRTFARRVSSTQEFNPDYTYVRSDLKRIGILAGSFFVLLIALSFIVPLIIK
jgi:hypothetical protein